MHIDPHDLDDRQGPRQRGTMLDAEQDGQESREADEREDLGAGIEPRGHEGQRGEPAEDDGPGRPIATAGGHGDRQGDRRGRRREEDHPRDASQGVGHRQGDLEPPVEVDPGSIRRREGEDVESRDAVMLEDPPPRSEMPPDVGVEQLVAAEQQGEDRHGDHRAARRPDASSPVRGHAQGRSSGVRSRSTAAGCPRRADRAAPSWKGDTARIRWQGPIRVLYDVLARPRPRRRAVRTDRTGER